MLCRRSVDSDEEEEDDDKCEGKINKSDITSLYICKYEAVIVYYYYYYRSSS